MRAIINEWGVTLWASASDTYEWASRPNDLWPCSELSGRRFVAEFDASGNLVDLSIDGGRGDQDVSGTELSACCADLLRGRLEESHPAHFGIIGQFVWQEDTGGVI